MRLGVSEAVNPGGTNLTLLKLDFDPSDAQLLDRFLDRIELYIEQRVS